PKAHGGRHPRLDAGGAGLGQNRNRRRGRRAFTTPSQRVYRQFTTVRQAQLGDGPDAQNIKDWRRKAMTRGIASLLFAILLAGALPPPAMAQPAARPLSFASVAQATLQDNLQLRAAASDVSVAHQHSSRQALLAAENGAAAQRSMAQANESLRVAQARFSAGAGARLDVLQAEVAVASAEQALVQAQTGVRNAQANLNALINLPLDTPLALTDTLTPRPVDVALADAIA